MIRMLVFIIAVFTFAAYITGTSLCNGLFVGLVVAFLYAVRKEKF